jgi:excisionase family DNA binding protein
MPTAEYKSEPDGAKSGVGNLLTVSEAAALKGVSRRALYQAIRERRLPSVSFLGKLGLKESDVLAYQPVAYKGRPGRKGPGGRPKGALHSDEARARISASQLARWAQRRAPRSDSGAAAPDKA